MSYHPAAGVGLDPGVPAPPPGPGAAPPFASPPADRSKRNLWIGLGVGGTVLLLCCVGGIFGVGVLLISGTEQAKDQAKAAVTSYLDALLDGNYAGARTLYCERLAARVSTAELAEQTRDEPFTNYRLDEPRLATYVDVPAHLSTASGEVNRLFQLDTEGTGLCIVGIR